MFHRLVHAIFQLLQPNLYWAIFGRYRKPQLQLLAISAYHVSDLVSLSTDQKFFNTLEDQADKSTLNTFLDRVDHGLVVSINEE